jgi:hypothetical protein
MKGRISAYITVLILALIGIIVYQDIVIQAQRIQLWLVVQTQCGRKTT